MAAPDTAHLRPDEIALWPGRRRPLRNRPVLRRHHPLHPRITPSMQRHDRDLSPRTRRYVDRAARPARPRRDGPRRRALRIATRRGVLRRVSTEHARSSIRGLAPTNAQASRASSTRALVVRRESVTAGQNGYRSRAKAPARGTTCRPRGPRRASAARSVQARRRAAAPRCSRGAAGCLVSPRLRYARRWSMALTGQGVSFPACRSGRHARPAT